MLFTINNRRQYLNNNDSLLISWKNKLIVVAVKKKHVRGFYAVVSNLDGIDLNIRVCFSAAGNAALSQRSKIRN